MKAFCHKLFLIIPVVFLLATNTSSGQAPSDGKFTMMRIRRGPAVDTSDMMVSASDIAALGVNSVVNISAVRLVKRSPLQTRSPLQQLLGQSFYSPVSPSQTENSLGSGVFISEDGYVVTNNHVVENAGVIKVTWTGRREFDAEIAGTDPGTDLAVIRLKGNYADLIPATFGNSDSVRIGDFVMAIGSPFSLNRSVSLGIVSGLGRANFGVLQFENFIQTDAAINPGNSGGALINMRGELIGINSAILSSSGGSQGIGLAIPSNMVLDIVEQILKNGRVIRGSLGLRVQPVNQDMIDAFKLPKDAGVIVTEVAPGSPAERAGLKRADIITKINDTEINQRYQFRNMVAFSSPGDKVQLTLVRGGREMKVNATIVELKLPQEQKDYGADWKPKPGGLTVTALSPDIRRQMKIAAEVPGHVVVAQIEPGSAAESAGFAPGDIILEINHKPVTSLDRYSKMYRESKRSAIFFVRRQEETFFCFLRSK